MIHMTVDGKVVHPDTSQSIKITYENPFVKDSGTYSYEIQFPMAILENRMAFGNIDRLEVRKRKVSFDDCKMYVGNRLVMDGKGTVTNITNTTVSLQLIGGKSRIKYNSRFEKHYIDEIDYPDVVISSGLNKAIYDRLGKDSTALRADRNFRYLFPLLDKSPIVGQPGVAMFSPICDETNSRVANDIIYWKNPTISVEGIKFGYNGTVSVMTNLAVQPNLIYILKRCMEYEGYTLDSSAIDREPWNRLYIASARRSVKIKEALPHWTVYQLIEEVRKLLNVTFVFDDTARTVRIADTNEQGMQASVSYEPADEFSCEYDEEGLSSYLTSNLGYQLDDSGNRMWWDNIPLGVMRAYDIKTFASESDATQWAKAQTEKVQKTTILKIEKQAYTIYMIYYKGEDVSYGSFHWTPFVHCGFFSPVVRDIESDDTVTINICPAAMYRTTRPSDLQHAADQMHGKEVVMPSVANLREAEAGDMTYDEAGDDYYYSVQDAIETGTVEQQEEGEVSQEPMPVMFAASTVRALDRDQTIAVDHNFGNPELRYPMTYTHFLMFEGSWQTDTEPGSLTLQHMSVSGRAGRKDIEVDKNNKLCVKFYTDDIPDPSLIYIFRGKRYLCEKVELNITAAGISKEKTGYFYEMM